MKRIYHNYKLWEDYINGMWKKIENESESLKIAIEFTGDHIKYGNAMKRVIKEWPITCEHNLTDNSINQKAFIGHCAVCLELGIPEYITRMAWHHLTDEQRNLANLQADNAIKLWNQQQNKQYVIQNLFD